MQKPLESLTNAKLAELIETRGKAVSVAMDVVFGQFDRMDIPFNDCCSQLGADHAAVVDYRAKSDAHAEAQSEARMRLGNEPNYMLCTYLAKSPRYVRVKFAKAA